MSIDTSNNINFSPILGSHDRATGSPVALDIGENSDKVVVPGGDMLLRADFMRNGDDLLITSPDGNQFVIIGYFNTLTAVDLMTEGGAMLPFGLVSALAGPEAPNQYAQTENDIGSSPIGRVDEAIGEVIATRVDGTTVTLTKDSSVFEGDVLETGAGGAVAVVFIDETEFSLGEEGRMVLDELIFDPTSMEGSSTFSVVQGVFVFVSGEIAANNPDEMLVKTPVAVIGIRGTKVAGKAAAEGELNTVTMMPESEGAVIGSITVSTQTTSITLNTAYQTTAVSSVFEAPAPPITLSANQAGTLYGAVSSLLPETSTPTRAPSESDRRGDDASSNNNSLAAESAGGDAPDDGSSTANEENAVLLEEVPLEELEEAGEQDLELEEGLEPEVEFGPEGELGPREGFGPEGEFDPNEGLGPDGEFNPAGNLANLSPEEAVALAEEFGLEPPKIGPDGELAPPEGFNPDGEFGPNLSPEEAASLAKELGFSPDEVFRQRTELSPDEGFGPEGGDFGKETFVVAGLAAAEDAFNVLQETFESGGTFDEALQAADSAGSVAFNAYMGAAGTDMFDALVDLGPEAVFADPSALNTFGSVEGQFTTIAESFGIDPTKIGAGDNFGQKLAPTSEFEGDFSDFLKDDPELANALKLSPGDGIQLDEEFNLREVLGPEGDFGPNENYGNLSPDEAANLAKELGFSPEGELSPKGRLPTEGEFSQTDGFGSEGKLGSKENFGNLTPDEAAALAKEGGFSPEGELGPKDRLPAEGEFSSEKGVKTLQTDGQGPKGEFDPSGRQVKEGDLQSIGSAKPVEGDIGPSSSKIGASDFGPSSSKIGSSDFGPSSSKIGSEDFGPSSSKIGASDFGQSTPKNEIGEFKFSFKQDFKFFKFKPSSNKKEEERNEENQQQEKPPENAGIKEIGDSSANILTGGPNDDFISGLGGNDTLFGLTGNDKLLGGEGDDVLEGNAGQDELTGGNGNDFFFYSTPTDGASARDGQIGLTTGDIIKDFTSGDKFEILNSGFGFSGTGTLSSSLFVSKADFNGTNADVSSGAYFVFDPNSFTLYHDTDETIDGYSVIATFDNEATISNSDITLNS